LTLFLLSFFTTGSYGQGAYKPCAAHRWNSGEAWFKDPSTGKWTGIPATGQTQPQGVVGCASAAATESGLEQYAGIYNPADFEITGLSDCFSQVTETFGNSLTGPTPGEQIVWFNFDIRPLAGTYQFQVVTNEPVGWALYYVDPADARPNSSDPAGVYPPTPPGISGNCLNLKPANILSGGVSHGNCGIAGNGWSTITVPSFNKPTNYYLAMWMAPANVTTFTNNMNLIYKSRYGCGGATCTLEFLNQTFECSANGYTVCGTFGGSAGRWILQDNATVKATSYTVTTYKQDGTTIVTGPTTYTSLNGTQTVTLGIIPDGAVYAKICATYPTSQPYNISLLPDGTFTTGGSDYITCSDGASFSGVAPVPPVVDASPNTQNLDLSKAHVANFTATTTGGTGTITYAWTQLTPDANTSFTFNSSTGAATFTVNALSVPLPLSYDFKVVATDAIGCTSEEIVHVIPEATLEPCGIYGPATTCANTTGLVYTYGDAGPPPTPYTLNTADYTYTWSISGNGTITSGTTDAGTVTVSSTTAGTFIVTMTIHNKPPGILPDRTCTFTVTLNAIPDAPGAGNNARCGPGTVTLSATGCSGGTLNWYAAASGGTSLGTGSTFTTPSISTTTTYYVSCTVGDCVSPRTAVTATVNSLGAVAATPTSTTCGQNNGGFTITSPVGAGITYSINGGAPTSQTTFSGLSAGFYSILAIGTGGCTSSGSVTVGSSTSLGPVVANGTPTTCGLNNGSITITSPVGAGITYSLNGGTPQTGTTFSNLAAGTYSILAHSTAGCTSSGSATVGGSQPCLTYCSYTQGFWGNKNGLKLLPGLLTTPIVIGRPGHSFTIPAGSATMVNNAMPGGTTPRMLLPGDCVMSTAANGCFKTSYSTKQGKFNNVLLSQTITLTLNTRLAGNPLLTLPIQSGCLVTGMGSFEMNQSVVNYLTYNGASATVADLLNLANDLLGGTLTPGANVGTPSKPRIVPSYSDVTSAIDAINNAFDGCTSFNGYQTCITTSLVVMARVAPGASTISDHVKVSAYPNPYTDKVRFTIKSTVSGQGSLDVFNMVGQKVKTVYQGYVHANTEQVVEYRVPDVSRQNLIFVMTVNGEKVTGKLLNAKE
jgi:hypothetical protein